MWQIGSDNGFNSSPKQVLYAYANYKPIPTIPFVWSHTYVYTKTNLELQELTVCRITAFNVAISVLCTFILLVKAVMFVLHIWFPLLGTVTNAIITALWAVSLYGQAGPDHSDPNHPSNVAWYVSKSCSYAKPSGNEHYCLQAKGAFAITVVMMYAPSQPYPFQHTS